MKVFWSKFALNSLREIYKYYKDNVGDTIASNIRNSVVSSTRQLENQPLSGSIEGIFEDLKEDHRFIVRGNYKIIYKIQNKRIYITDVFDCRQNPEKIKKSNQ